MRRRTGHRPLRLFTTLPLDVLLHIIYYCDFFDILNLSALQNAADERQVWLRQVRLLQIPIPPGTTPSKEELKDWTVSRVKVDIRWVKTLSGEDEDDLAMHRFDFDEDPLTSAYYLPGGEFLVFLHASGSISLKRIDGLAEVDEWELSEVARYEPRNAEGRPAFSSETLNEISYGRFALAYTVEGNSDRLFVFYIDNILQVIEEGPVVQIDQPDEYHLNDAVLVPDSVWVAKGTIFYFCAYQDEDYKYPYLFIVHLGAEVVQRHFWVVSPRSTVYAGDYHRFFVISENGVVVCEPYGIHLYHIPEFEDEPDLSPFWSSDGILDGWCRGSLCNAGSPNPTLYVHHAQGTEILEFGLDEDGCFSVVTAEELVHHDDDWGEEIRRYDDDLGQPIGCKITLRGKKVLYYKPHDMESPFLTLVTASMDEDAGRVFCTPIANSHHDEPVHVRRMDLDERTGRLLIVVGYTWTPEGAQSARRVYLADLPE